MNKDNNFQESFKQLRGLGLSSRSFSIQQPAAIPVFHFFKKVNKGQLEMVNINY